MSPSFFAIEVTLLVVCGGEVEGSFTVFIAISNGWKTFLMSYKAHKYFEGNIYSKKYNNVLMSRVNVDMMVLTGFQVMK